MVLSMNRWRGKVAVITGAAGGIGSAVVEQLLKEGLKVVGVDNNSKTLEDLSKRFKNTTQHFHAYLLDVTEEKEVTKFYQEITETLGPVHILVNSAGVLILDTLINGDTKNWKKILDVNLLSIAVMTREAIKIMRYNKIDGHIVHLGSISCRFVPDLPRIHIYPACKSALLSMTESLRQELNRFNLKIKVTLMCPGRVDTLMITDNSDIFTGKVVCGTPDLEPGDVANSIMYALSTPPHVQVHEICIKPVGELL